MLSNRLTYNSLFPCTTPWVQKQPSSLSFSTAATNAIRSENGNAPEDDPLLRAGLRAGPMPRHVSALLDGSRRWAKAHGKELDYEPVFQCFLNLADLCITRGIPTLSCAVSSTETWKRSKEANDLLFRQLQECLEEGLETLAMKGIKVVVIGEKARLPKSLQEAIKEVEEATMNNSKLELIYAVSYGAKWEIVEAIRSMTEKAMAGEIKVDDIDEEMVKNHLLTSSLRFPDPDLMIRTGGDQRVSNYMVWQMSHTELYFTRVLAPDFREPHFDDALRWYQHCGRRFGK